MAIHPQETIVRHLVGILEEALESTKITSESKIIDNILNPILREYNLVSKKWKINCKEGWLFDIIVEDRWYSIVPQDEDSLDYTLAEYERAIHGE